MTPVFAHGSLRLYLLSLLAEQPRHGYELIQALSDRFGGTYIPSAGTIYPRLAKLEEEGLVTKSTDGRKTVYEITDAGRAELQARQGDLHDLETEVADSVRRLADDVRSGVSEAMRSLRLDLASAKRQAGDARSARKAGAAAGARAGAAAASAAASASAGAGWQTGPAESAASGSTSGTTFDGTGARAGTVEGDSGSNAASTPDPRLESNRALHEADLVLNEFRQQLRADLRQAATRSGVPTTLVPELRARLVEVRADILAALHRQRGH
ncbi:PadR family transcriptional regulator [Cryobacterium sp. TMT2-4]|nr:PadR family transcriptional regulator [Cryobacterium sp. TMT2-4]